MASLSQALLLGYLPSPHSAFQEHAAHPIEWSMALSSKSSSGTCIPEVLRHSSISRTLKVRGGMISQAHRYLGCFCSSQRIFLPQIIQVLLTLCEWRGSPSGWVSVSGELSISSFRRGTPYHTDSSPRHISTLSQFLPYWQSAQDTGS